MSNHDVDIDLNSSSIEFTLEDTYDHLRDLKHEKEEEIKKLISFIKNNIVKTLKTNVTPEEIRQKRVKFVQSMGKLVAQEQPTDLTISSTPDFYNSAFKELEDEVRAIEELDKITDEEILELEKDIAYLETKKVAFQKMKEASISAAENVPTSNYEAEMIVIKRLFKEVKADLEIVVDTLFPENKGFQELLCILTRALSKGGDDLYIDVTPNVLVFVNFLEEADIIQFHPNDKTKIKLRNL